MANLEENKKHGDGFDDEDIDAKDSALLGDSEDSEDEVEDLDSWEIEEDLEE